MPTDPTYEAETARDLADPNTSRLFTVKEAAALIDRSPRLIRHLIATGRLPTFGLDSRWPHGHLIRAQDLLAIASRPRKRSGPRKATS